MVGRLAAMMPHIVSRLLTVSYLMRRFRGEREEKWVTYSIQTFQGRSLSGNVSK